MIRQPKETNLALKDIATGEIHYFNYVVDYRDAYNQMDPDTGKRRFAKADGTDGRKFSPRGEEVFEKPEEKIMRGRKPRSSSIAETPKAPEEIPGTETGAEENKE